MFIKFLKKWHYFIISCLWYCIVSRDGNMWVRLGSSRIQLTYQGLGGIKPNQTRHASGTQGCLTQVQATGNLAKPHLTCQLFNWPRSTNIPSTSMLLAFLSFLHMPHWYLFPPSLLLAVASCRSTLLLLILISVNWLSIFFFLCYGPGPHPKVTRQHDEDLMQTKFGTHSITWNFLIWSS